MENMHLILTLQGQYNTDEGLIALDRAISEMEITFESMFVILTKVIEKKL